MKVLVTGGAGFIGSHVVDLCLAKGHEITVLDNLTTGRAENLAHVKNQIEFVECDLGSTGSWHGHFKNKDWVIHLAALADIVPSIQNPQEYFAANVTGTFNVLQASIDHHVRRFIYSASSSCYGLATKFPTPEDAPIMPQYPYALTKRLGEELVLHWANIFDLPALSLRFFNVYGPRSRTSGTYGAVFGVFLAQKLANQPFTIVGDGKQTRDFTYVSDVADAVLAATESNVVGKIFNVGSGKSVSINRIVELLEGKTTFIPKRPGEPECTFADISKIQSVLGWSPKVPIEEGISRLLNEIDYWKEAVVWTPDSIAEATKDWFEKLGKNDAN